MNCFYTRLQFRLVWCCLLALCCSVHAAAQDGIVQPIPDALDPVYIHGRVVNETGEAVPGVRVVANHSGFGETIYNAWINANRTGVNGMAAVSGLDGSFTIRVPYAGIGYDLGFAPGDRFHTAGASVIPRAEAEAVELLAMPYGRRESREVEVLNPEGTPAIDVPVTLVSQHGVRWTQQTDQSGRVVFERLDVGFGLRQAGVEVQTEGGLVAPITSLSWHHPDEATTVFLTDPAAMVGTIRALDTGEPIAGATVVVSTVFTSGLEWRTTTEEEGWFQLTDLPPGEYCWRVISPTHAEWRGRGWHWNRRRVRLRPGEMTEVERINVQPRAVLRGRVLGPNGQPVQGAMVACSAHIGDDRQGNDLVFTDEAGRFEFHVGQFGHGLPPLQVYHSIAGVAWQRLDPMQPGEVREDIELVTAGSIRITGTVTGADGQPLPGIGCHYTLSQGPTVYTDDAGRYDLGRILLLPSDDGCAAEPRPVAFFSVRPEVGLQSLPELQDPPAEGPYYIPAARETVPGTDGDAVVDVVLVQTDLLTFAGTLTGLVGKSHEEVLVYLLSGRVTDLPP